jgi:hypothetical protein
MQVMERKGPTAPKDPEKKRPYFFIMQGKGIFGAPQPDGRGIQFIYENDGRIIDAAKLSGNVTDEEMLENLKSTRGFRKMVHSIGVSVSSRINDEKVKFVMQMYPRNPGEPATEITKEFETDGMETTIDLADVSWVPTDYEIGQIRFEFPESGVQAMADVRFYLNDGFTAPPQPMEYAVDFESDGYKEMIARSLMKAGNTKRLEKVLEKAAMGEEVTLSFIGGSITQGAGAIPIHEKSYARLFANEFEKKFSKEGKVKLVKAGVGGTPSELGMIRFERDVLRDGQEQPDLVVIEFAVNDEGDETKGVCYESLVRKALALPWKPAVILLFAVFSYDWNLQDRLSPVGERYNLPMVSILNAVTPQFSLLPQDGRVISKNQFFYDVYHPSNLGHQVMCDSLLYVLDEVNAGRVGSNEEEKPVEDIAPVLGKDFEKVILLDRKEMPLLKSRFGITLFEMGAFSDIDKDLQKVEMDSEITQVPEFPYNWAHLDDAQGDDPFRIKLSCKKLLLVFKDSGLPTAGTAEVFVDGKKVMDADPLKTGWTHCNPVIILNEEETKEHEVEIRMAKDMAGKKFTILGFGVVE